MADRKRTKNKREITDSRQIRRNFCCSRRVWTLRCHDYLNFPQNVCNENQYIAVSNGISKHVLPVSKFSLSMSTVIPRPGCNTYVIHHWTLNPISGSTYASSASVERNP